MAVFTWSPRLARIRASLAELESTAKELYESGRLADELERLDDAIRTAERRLQGVPGEGRP